MRISDWSSDVCSSDLGRTMQGNGEHQPIDGALPAAARGSGFATPFDRAAWFDLLAAHGFAPAGRFDAWGTAGGEARATTDRKSVGEGKSVSVLVDPGGRRLVQKKKKPNNQLAI